MSRGQYEGTGYQETSPNLKLFRIFDPNVDPTNAVIGKSEEVKQTDLPPPVFFIFKKLLIPIHLKGKYNLINEIKIKFVD